MLSLDWHVRYGRQFVQDLNGSVVIQAVVINNITINAAVPAPAQEPARRPVLIRTRPNITRRTRIMERKPFHSWKGDGTLFRLVKRLASLTKGERKRLAEMSLVAAVAAVLSITGTFFVTVNWRGNFTYEQPQAQVAQVMEISEPVVSAPNLNVPRIHHASFQTSDNVIKPKSEKKTRRQVTPTPKPSGQKQAKAKASNPCPCAPRTTTAQDHAHTADDSTQASLVPVLYGRN